MRLEKRLPLHDDDHDCSCGVDAWSHLISSSRELPVLFVIIAVSYGFKMACPYGGLFPCIYRVSADNHYKIDDRHSQRFLVCLLDILAIKTRLCDCL